jgi:hypothetical protein
MLVGKIEITFVELRRSGMLKKLNSSEQLWWRHEPMRRVFASRQNIL